jgi:hypothetical protein
MRVLRIYGHCDRAMLYPQPTRWAATYDEAEDALVNDGPWDKIEIVKLEDGRYEDLGLFLRDNPQHRPHQIELSWGIDPFFAVKLKMWVPGQVIDW